jgi:hypothetical protein
MRDGWYLSYYNCVVKPKRSYEHLIFHFKANKCFECFNISIMPGHYMPLAVELKNSYSFTNSKYVRSYLEDPWVILFEYDCETFGGCQASIKEMYEHSQLLTLPGDHFLDINEIVTAAENLISYSKGSGSFAKDEAELLVELLSLIHSQKGTDESTLILSKVFKKVSND